MKIHKILLLSLAIIGFQQVFIGSNFAQTSQAIQELARERAKERKPILKIDKKAKAGKQDKIEEEKALVKIKHKEEDKKRQVIQKPGISPEGPRVVQESGDLDKELKDWLDKLKTIESTLP